MRFESLASVVGAMCAFTCIVRIMRETKVHSDDVRARKLVATTWACSMCLWCVAWKACKANASSLAHMGLLWPAMVMIYDVNICEGDVSSSFTVDANVINSLCFGLSAALTTSGDDDHKRLFILPLVIFVCAALPQINQSDDTASAQQLRILQRIAISCSAGCLLTGVFYQPLHKTVFA